MTTFAERQRQRRASGQVGTAALVDRIAARDPHLGAYADGLLVAIPDEDPRSQVALIAEARDLIRSLQLRNARDEQLGRLADLMAAEPDAPTVPAWRERFAAVVARVRDLERSGTARARPWAGRSGGRT